jgi:hypothetical protein
MFEAHWRRFGRAILPGEAKLLLRLACKNLLGSKAP